jgi:hypothetical protein
MQKRIAKKLDTQVQKVAERFSRKDRVGNVNGEDFSVKSCYALSDYTAFVRFNKTTTKDAIALFFYDKDYWQYFFPTDNHIFGFRCFEVIKITGQTHGVVGGILDIDNFREKVKESLGKKPNMKFSGHMFMTNDTAAIRYEDESGNEELTFFYYIHKGMSKGWRYFTPNESHINGFRLFELEKFSVEKENYDKNFIVAQ